MPKITAIHSGGDWTDASADYLILPLGMDIEKEANARSKWYREEYLTKKDKKFVTLTEWCLNRGARIPNHKELEIYDLV